MQQVDKRCHNDNYLLLSRKTWLRKELPERNLIANAHCRNNGTYQLLGKTVTHMTIFHTCTSFDRNCTAENTSTKSILCEKQAHKLEFHVKKRRDCRKYIIFKDTIQKKMWTLLTL
ncbi:MAG: hypothetical protein ACI4QH_01735, partial [Candidatus Fimimonas sp.]